MYSLENLITKVEAINETELTTNQISCLEIGLEEGFRLTDDLVRSLDTEIERLEAEIILLIAINLN